MIAMISAIGGTLGICTGFSFKECVKSVFIFFERVIQWNNKNNFLTIWKFKKSEEFQVRIDGFQRGTTYRQFESEAAQMSKEMSNLKDEVARYLQLNRQLEERIKSLEERLAT